jgi:D-alanyl-D-alanine carboxypeptidase (penicillin-binding protein 5/6)
MNEHPDSQEERFSPSLPEAEQSGTPAHRFPVAAQLLVLALILFAVPFVLIGPSAYETGNASLDTAAGQENAPLVAVREENNVEPTREVEITARAAFVWDADKERVLYQKNADEVLPLASLTKLMTALLAYELVDEGTRITVPYAAVLQESVSGLRSGEVFTARRLADLALISSSNDAAYALAAAVGALLGHGEPEEMFVAGMNIRARELNLPTLRFYNPTGLDVSTGAAGAYGSAREVAFLMDYIIKHHPTLLTITTLPRARVFNEAGEHHEAENTNRLVGAIPNLLGSKTGHTDLSGGNLSVAYDIGYQRPIIVVVLGSTRQGRFSDVYALTEKARSLLAESP